MNEPGFDLALDTSWRGGCFALGLGDRVVAGRLDGERSHASDLLERIAVELSGLGQAPEHLRLTVVGLGPGSFTGLRVGVATALGLSRGSGGPLVGVPSVEVQCAAALAPNERALVVSDARGGRFTLAGYARDAEGALSCWLEPRAETLEPWRSAVRAALEQAPCRLLGDASCAERLDPELAERVEAPPPPDGRLLLERGRHKLATQGPDDPALVRPLYLFPFEAKPRKR
ncbi:MAG: tRNA (adenosine(37)-N6)-threonylcarbamoyltransferase complex dimerization subunit type 1 TsaB [Planctomycetota bacterium]